MMVVDVRQGSACAGRAGRGAISARAPGRIPELSEVIATDVEEAPLRHYFGNRDGVLIDRIKTAPVQDDS
jgi:hypothetical protein